MGSLKHLMKKLFPFLFLIMASCNSTDRVEPPQVNSSELRFSEISDPSQQGQNYELIEFKNNAGEKIWVSMENPAVDLKALSNADEIIVSAGKITVVIDYPLSKAVEFDMTAHGAGITPRQLVTEISKRYHQIYLEEEQTSKIKSTPVNERKLVANRNETDGKYGIYGHDLSDLDMSMIQVFKTSGGRTIIWPIIDS